MRQAFKTGALSKAFAAMIALAALSLSQVPASAQTMASLTNGASTLSALEGKSKPIAGWVDFCKREPAECAFDPSEPEEIVLTPKIWKLISDTNLQVNKSIRPVSDLAYFGEVDYWTLPNDGIGDCEDFQLLKRHILVEKGLPARAMRMTVVTNPKGDGHAVLMIITDRGDFVLDNLSPVIKPWNKTPYTYIKRESQADPQAWVSLGGATAAQATAAAQR